jgi:signal transduction histidine kinase
LERLEKGGVTYDVSVVMVAEVLAEVEAMVWPQARAKDLRLVFKARDRQLAVYADRNKLRQILLNLLANAVHHSPAGAQVMVEAERREGTSVAIRVRDSGPGIPLEQQSSIFEPFVQLGRSLTNTVGGVGLGLSISRDLARGMGGSISVESAPGAGASFIVSLPAAFGRQRISPSPETGKNEYV